MDLITHIKSKQTFPSGYVHSLTSNTWLYLTVRETIWAPKKIENTILGHHE